MIYTHFSDSHSVDSCHELSGRTIHQATRWVQMDCFSITRANLNNMQKYVISADSDVLSKSYET